MQIVFGTPEDLIKHIPLFFWKVEQKNLNQGWVGYKFQLKKPLVRSNVGFAYHAEVMPDLSQKGELSIALHTDNKGDIETMMMFNLIPRVRVK